MQSSVWRRPTAGTNGKTTPWHFWSASAVISAPRHERISETGPDMAHDAHDAHRAGRGVGDHDKHRGHSVEVFRREFWGTLLLSIPTVIWAPMIQHWFGYEAPGGPVASRWI